MFTKKFCKSNFKMKWFILLVVIIITEEAFGEKNKVKTLSRSPRSLSSNNNAYNNTVYKLDHFIELVEKIERHPLMSSKPLQVIVNYIRSLGYSDQKWNKLLGKSETLPEGILTTDEKRILRLMLDHGFSGQQERGVVNTPHGDVAMGRAITGISAGINRNQKLVLKEIYVLSPKHMDNLYAATIAGDVALAGLLNKADPSSPPLFGPGGTWSPNTQCPDVYTLLTSSHSAAATDARILGGIDGFLIGSKISEWSSATKVRLGQLLRMYYRGGVVYDKNYAACRRFDTFQEMVGKKKLIVQTMLSMYAVKKVWPEGADYSGIQTSAIPKLAQTITEHLINYLKALKSDRGTCPTENDKKECILPANLVFVMDESGSITSKNYEIEKDFVKNITDAFNILPYETRVAVIEYSSNAHVSIKLNEYASKSRLKCAVDRLDYLGGGTYTMKGLKLAYDILQKAQSGNNSQNDLQIIVLLTDGRSSDSDIDLKNLVTNLKRNITRLTIVSVGIGNYKMSELELIATDPIKHVFTATDFGKLVNLVKSLRKQACQTAMILKPITIAAQQQGDEGKKTEAKVSGYVSPGKARYFTLPKETLFKTENISLEVKPTYGTVTLYVSRTNESPGPDNYDFKMEVSQDDIPISRRKRSTSAKDNAQGKRPRILQFYNLCKGYNETTCPPLHIAVFGKNSSQSCSDLDCSVPTQIKFELKTEQIIPKKENSCYFELEASKIYEAKDVSIKISAVKDTISYYISRVRENPDLYNNSYKMKHVVAGQIRTIPIPKPCKEYNKATCPPVYFFFRGAQLKCHCTGRNCTLPSQVDVKVNFEVKNEVEPKVCYHKLAAEQLFDHGMVEIKVSPVKDTITLYSSRVNKYPDKSNHSQKLDDVAVGQTNSLNISHPCKGFDRSTCLPLYLTFTGKHLTCNCTGEVGKQICFLPEEVSMIFTKEASPSSAWPLETSVCLIIVTFVFSFSLFSNLA